FGIGVHQVRLFEVGQQVEMGGADLNSGGQSAAHEIGRGGHQALGRGQHLARVVEVVASQRQLLDLIGTGGPGGGFADLLDGGHEQADEDGDDGNDDQQVD